MILRLGLYLGIGALCHAVVVGVHFDWTNAWTLAWLFAWPLMLFVTFWAVIVVGFIGIGVVYALWLWIGLIARWRARWLKRGRSA